MKKRLKVKAKEIATYLKKNFESGDYIRKGDIRAKFDLYPSDAVIIWKLLQEHNFEEDGNDIVIPQQQKG